MYKFHYKLISLVLLISTLFSLVSLGAVSASAASDSIITTDAVRLRSSAEIVSDNIITTLGVNEELTLLRDSAEEWAYVRRMDGTTGYCSVNYLQPAEGSAVVLTGVTNDAVNFRKGPSTNYESMGMLDKGTEFTVLDNSEETWVKAEVGANTGYIYRSYTDLVMKLGNTKTPDWFESSALEDMVGGDYESDDKTSLVNDIALSDQNITVEEGRSYTLMAYIPGGVSAQNTVVFTSSNKNVAVVTSSGLVKGVSVGSAVITATSEISGKKASCNVTVVEATTEPSTPTTEPTTSTTEPTIPTEPTLKLSSASASVSVGNHYMLTANQAVSWKSSNTSVATVSGGVVTAKATGTATITASTSSQKATCKITVTSAPSGITIYKNAVTVTAGKTYYNGITSSSKATWSSSDTSVATVTNGFITAVSQGKAVISAKNSYGTKTCVVTVSAAEPIRFAYSEPNTAAPGETITLCAVTDKTRTAVKFEVTVGSSVKTVNATSKTTDSNTLVWTGTTTISTSGTHSVVAYSKTSGAWQTSSVIDDAKTTVFIRKSSSITADTLETRRASDKVIKLISQFEGYSPCVYFDTIANNIPTLGYGRVVYVGESFYNDMTKKEAFAYLVRTVNNDGYTSSVNNYLDKYNIYRNQHQFDSLVSFVYNLGPYILSGDSDFREIFTASSSSHQDPVTGKEAYINATDVNFRSGPGTSYTILDVLAYGTVLELIETSASNGWYHVRTKNGTAGYVSADYVTKGTLSSSGKYSLNNVNKADLTKLMLQYHHAGSTCVWGLLYRRVDELDVFFYADYTQDGRNNKYGYDFTCSVNSSTTI